VPEEGDATPAYHWKGNWLHLNDEHAPVVFVLGRTSKHATMDDFLAYVAQHRHSIHDGMLTYQFEDADGHDTQIRMSLEDHRRLPEINGKPMQLTGQRTFDSPYLLSSPSGAVVTIEKGHRKMVLDFRRNEE
jgi:hypothetical protein